MLFLTLYEPWVLQVDIAAVKDRYGEREPDHPISRLSKTSTKRERTGVASIHLMQSKDCIQEIAAIYFNDWAETSVPPHFSLVPHSHFNFC